MTAQTGGFDRRTGRDPAGGQGTPGGASAVCGVLLDTAAQPAFADLAALAQTSNAFGLTGVATAPGHAELIAEGMLFDCQGLAPAPMRRIAGDLALLALPQGFAAEDHAMVTLAPAAQWQGAARLLPVVRVIATLAVALASLPGARGVVWLPARLVSAPQWFAEAVSRWLDGGPFPALALTGLARTAHGIESRGLAFFTGQEFVLSGAGAALDERDARGAVRLTDWMVAHGVVQAPCEVDLAGYGVVSLVPDGANRVIAHRI